jgi:hypothetical protein
VVLAFLAWILLATVLSVHPPTLIALKLDEGGSEGVRFPSLHTYPAPIFI